MVSWCCPAPKLTPTPATCWPSDSTATASVCTSRRSCAPRPTATAPPLIAAHPYRRRFLAEPAQDPDARAEMLHRAAADPCLRLFDAIESCNERGSAAEKPLRRGLAPASGPARLRRQRRPPAPIKSPPRPPASGGASHPWDDLVAEIRAGRMTAVNLAAAVPPR